MYPQEDFHLVSKYNLSLYTASNPKLANYIRRITSQLEKWIAAKQIAKLVLVIASKDTRETLERWQFDVHCQEKAQEKIIGTINKEIAALLRQISASISFLPIFDDTTFNILAYTEKDTLAPQEWIDSDPRLIPDAQVVKLRGFSTGVHQVDSEVSYKLND